VPKNRHPNLTTRPKRTFPIRLLLASYKYLRDSVDYMRIVIILAVLIVASWAIDT